MVVAQKPDVGTNEQDPWLCTFDETFGYRAVREFARRYPNAEIDQLAERYLSRLDQEKIREFAKLHILDEISGMRRAEAKAVEEEATRAREREEREAAASQRAEMQRQDQQRKREEKEAEREARYQEQETERKRMKDRPWSMGEHAVRSKDIQRVESFMSGFRRWMGADFDAWYAWAVQDVRDRAEEIFVSEAVVEEQVNWFRSDWEADFPKPDRWQCLMSSVNEMVEKRAREIRLELTQELLETTFALGDGRRVAWGDATVDQHRQRVTMLAGQAAGVAETAARHQAAINMIGEAGVDCLREVA